MIRRILSWLGIRAAGPEVCGIPNFIEFSPGSYRGGQPRDQAGWQYLKSLGVTHVVKLNTWAEGSDAEAQALGMKLLYLPIMTTQQLGITPLPADYFDQALQLPETVFVHCGSDARSRSDLDQEFKCQGGQDRTGLFVAWWRTNRQHWDKLRAQKEMLDCGFHRELAGLWEWWEDNY